MALALRIFALADLPEQSMTFEQCYRLYKERVYRWCLRYGGGSVAWAEDATQDIFITVHAQLPKLDQSRDLAAWLYTVTAHHAYKKLRREGSLLDKVLSVLKAEPEQHAESPEHVVTTSQETRALLDAVATLPANERMVVWMTLVDGKKGVEVAEALSISKGQVSKLLARGTERLKTLGWETGE
jgi:RNA polymerase sigma-70 factor (ECF subfamily)